MRNKQKFFVCLMVALSSMSIKANSIVDGLGFGMPSYIQQTRSEGSFRIAGNGTAAKICVDPSDWKGVVRAANDLGDDVCKVSGLSAKVISTTSILSSSVIVGTIGKSKLIDRLVSEKKIDVSEIQGKWESFLIQTVDGNLVIAGSDKRGTIYGIYDVSEKIGVSPWYWRSEERR